MPVVRRYTIDVDGRTVGYRCAGQGSPVLVVGSIARSSKSVVPLMELLADQHTVFAVDPPGYGASEPLPAESGVPVIAGALAAVLAELDVLPGVVVGVQSGGLVGVELARHSAQRPIVILDDMPVLDHDTRKHYASSYAPAVSIVADGTHVLRHWAMVKAEHSWFPWFDQVPDAALSLDLADVRDLQESVLDRILAGENYAAPYDAIWHYDPRPALSEVEVVALTPSVLQLGSPSTDLVPAGPDPAARRAVIARQVEYHTARGLIGSMVGPEFVALQRFAQARPRAARDRGRWVRDVVDTPWGQIALRSFAPHVSTTRPLVVLHASPLAGSSMLPLAAEFTDHRTVLVLDTPGNGDSDGIGIDEPDLPDFAVAMLSGLDDLGVDEFDVYGTHTGAMIGMELAIAAPQLVRNLAMNGVPVFQAEESAAALRDYMLDLTPKWDGTHLLSAWSNVRDVLTWYPWHDRDPSHRRAMAMPDAATLHGRFVQMISGGTTYPVVHRAVLRHATAERLPLVRVRTLIGCAPTDPLFEFLGQAVSAVQGAQSGPMTGRPVDDAVILQHFFEGSET